METNVEVIVQKDGYKTKLYQFLSKSVPTASILILHGMAEHYKRYITLAEFLNQKGIDVYLYNHRGHGTDLNQNELGFFHIEKGYEKVVNDAIKVLEHMETKGRCKKIILMGHSMGSLIARNVISRYNELNGVILCGTTHPVKLKLLSGLLVTKTIRLVKGHKHISPFINSLLFGGKTYTKLITRTSYDWLSRNNASVGAYIHDPYCGFICTISFYHDLIQLTLQATKTINMKKISKSLPILVISGECDPVGGNKKEIVRFINKLHKLGHSFVTSKLYPECRHELIQELNADEIMNDIYQWIQR